MSQPLLYQLFSRSVSILWRSLLLRGEQSEGQIYNAKLWTHFLATFMRFLLRCHSLSPQQPTGQGCSATSDPAPHFATSSLKRKSIRSPGSWEVRLWSLCVINTSSSFFFFSNGCNGPGLFFNFFFTKHSCSAVTRTEVSLWDSSLSQSHIPVNLSTEAAEALLLTNGD